MMINLVAQREIINQFGSRLKRNLLSMALTLLLSICDLIVSSEYLTFKQQINKFLKYIDFSSISLPPHKIDCTITLILKNQHFFF